MTSLALIFEKFPSALPSGVAHYITGPENPQAVKQKILDLFIAFMLRSENPNAAVKMIGFMMYIMKIDGKKKGFENFDSGK